MLLHYLFLSVPIIRPFPFLLGPNSQKVSLSWVRRLKIAVDAAKGMFIQCLCFSFKQESQGKT
jgi:hypothetical protein